MKISELENKIGFENLVTLVNGETQDRIELSSKRVFELITSLLRALENDQYTEITICFLEKHIK
jgi:hypothetical protein